MAINVAINGFGRIGRMVLRAAWGDRKINIVALNDLTDTKTLAHLLKYDSTHGTFPDKVGFTQDSIVIGKKKIRVYSERDPAKLPWKKHKVDVVVESTGFFRDPRDANLHVKAGAKKVIISAPCKFKDNNCPIESSTIVMGVNEKTYDPKIKIISNASCTTNNIAPTLKIINDAFGIKHCMFTTVHSWTGGQHLVDGPHKDLRRARSVSGNLIPTSSGADSATVQAIPALQGKIRGYAVRVPTPNGSLTDYVIELKQEVTVDDVNNLFKKAASGLFKKILEYSDRELVTHDIIGNSHSTVFDSKLTKVVDKRMLKVVTWYDNEWGYSCRMVDLIKHIA